MKSNVFNVSRTYHDFKSHPLRHIFNHRCADVRVSHHSLPRHLKFMVTGLSFGRYSDSCGIGWQRMGEDLPKPRFSLSCFRTFLHS